MPNEIKEFTNFNLPIVSNLSPLSDDYPIVVLSNGVKKHIDTTNKIISSICEKTFAFEGLSKNLAQAAKNSVDYVLELSQEQKDMIEKGLLKLTEENGHMFAQLKNGNHYGKKIPVVQKVVKGEIDYSQISNVMQFKALQGQIKSLADQVQIIGEDVKFALKGQQNDRIALYYSGIHLFMEAQNVSNESFKYQLMSQAIKALSDSVFKLTLEMQEAINYLKNKEYEAKGLKQFTQSNRLELIKDKNDIIHQCFGFIHQSYIMKAGIYSTLGEPLAMSKALEEYGVFLDSNIKKNLDLLNEYDPKAYKKGFWKAKEDLMIELKNVVEQLEKPNDTIYIDMEKVNEKK